MDFSALACPFQDNPPLPAVSRLAPMVAGYLTVPLLSKGMAAL